MVNPHLTEPTSDDKLWGGLSYAGLLCCMIPAIVIFFLKKDESAYIKFNSLQSIAYGLIWIVVIMTLNIGVGVLGQLVPILGLLGIFPMILGLGFFAYWIYLMIMAFTGKPVRIPYLADFIDQNLMGG